MAKLSLNNVTLAQEIDGVAYIDSSTSLPENILYSPPIYRNETIDIPDRQLLFYSWATTGNFSGNEWLTETEAPLNSFVMIRIHASGGGYSSGAATCNVINNNCSYYAQRTPEAITCYVSPYTTGLFPIIKESDRLIYWSGRCHEVNTGNETIITYKGYVKMGAV